MKKFIAILALVITLPAFAQDKPKPAAPATPPAISAELKAQFFKAQLALRAAQDAFQKAQQASTDSVNAINVACGADFQPAMDANGDPSCAAKLKPAEPAKK